MALADDPAVSTLFLFGKIFQMYAVEAVAQFVDDLDRVFAGADVVAKVGAKPDALVVTFDCL